MTTPAVRIAPVARVVAFLVVASCGGAGTDGPAVERETLPDGRVLVRYGAPVSPAEDSVVADVRIGSLDDAGPATFGQVRGIAVGHDGAIYVLDGQSAELRAFEPDGSYRATLARRGQGPGELTEAHGVAVAPDGSLWVNDSRNGAMIGLAPDGGEVGRHPLMVGGWSFIWSGTIDANGVFWEPWSHQIAGTAFDMTATGPTESTRHVFYKSFDPHTQAYDSVAIGRDETRGFRAALEGGGQMSLGIPHTAGRVSTIAPDATIWTARSGAYAITKMDPSGDTLLVLHMEAAPLPVTADDLERWRAPMRERLGPVVADLERLIPDHKPLLTRLLADDEGRLWVGRTVPTDEAPLFDVFDDDANYLGSVRLFERMSEMVAPVVRNGRAYALVRGELDEPYVVAGPLPASLRNPVRP